MEPFRFKKFEIRQQKQVFRVGTDGLLLGILSEASNAVNALEVGTGTGIISLMLAQRNPGLRITAIDISQEATSLARENFAISPFAERLTAVHCDFKNFNIEGNFDLIFSNPPFFPESSSEKDVLARQTVALDFGLLVSGCCGRLTDRGRLSVVIPAGSSSDFERTARESQLHLIRKVNIYGISGRPVKRKVLEFSRTKSDLIVEEFIVEKSPRKYSDQYLEMTKDFHVFNAGKGL